VVARSFLSEYEGDDNRAYKFLNETFDIGSKAAKWDIESLKAGIPV